MDEELRELEQAAQKTASAVGKGMNISEEMAQSLLDATKSIAGVSAKTVSKTVGMLRKDKDDTATAAKSTSVSDRVTKTRLENFTFTGKDTDLCYFANTDRMPLSAIDNLTDKELRENVIRCFDRMCQKKQGLVRVEGDEVVITDKGKKRLQEGAFRRRALDDQLEAYGKQFEKLFGQAAEGRQQLCVALNGHEIHDFAFFEKADALNLKQIAANPNTNLRDKIVANVKQWQQNGLIDIRDNVARLTQKGRELLQNTKSVKDAASKMTETAVDGVRHTADSIIVTTKTAAKKVAEKTAEVTQKAAKAAAQTAGKLLKKGI